MPFFNMVEGLADVKEKAASLAATTVKMKLEIVLRLASLCLCRCRLSCFCFVFRAGSLFFKVIATRRLGSLLTSANQSLEAFLCEDGAGLD